MSAARRWGIDRGGALVVIVGVTYAVLAPGHIVGGDNAELSTLGAVGGVAHPSGYPLYVLWLRAWSWLPGSPAHAAALATAILAAAAVAVLHAAARAWGARPASATIATALFAAAPTVVRMSTEAEVFALNSLVAASVLWLAAEAGPARGGRRALALGLVAGCGLANHMTCVLVAPIGLLGVVRAAREARSWPAAIGVAAAGFAAGLAPYAYLLVAPAGDASWRELHTLGELADHVLRHDYGGPSGFAGGRDAVPIWDNEAALVGTLARAWWYAPAALGIGVLAWRAARPGRGESRAAWCALAASFVLAGPVLVMRFNLPPEGLFLAMVQRFHILPALLLVIPIAVGLDRLTARVRPGVGAALGIAVFAAALAPELPRLAVEHSAIVEDGVDNLLSSLPPNAVLVVGPDDLVFGTHYVQIALGHRRDVRVVAWAELTIPWYRAQTERELGAMAGSEAPAIRIVRAALASGRPVVVDALVVDVRASFPSYPIGGLFRVLPPGAAPPSLDELLAQNRELFLQRYALAATPAADAGWAAEAYARYARTWAELGQLLERAGRAVDAGRAYGLAAQLHPGGAP